MMASSFTNDDFDDDILQFIEGEKKQNTVSITRSHISHLNKWLLEKKINKIQFMKSPLRY